MVDHPHPGGASRRIAVGAGAEIQCAIDDYTDGWTSPDTVLMLHGIAEQGSIWRPWVPHLARKHRVLRPDLRGFGASSPLPGGPLFTIADWADDMVRLVEALGSRRVHLVGTKLGALIAFELAQRRLPWVASMTLAGMLPSPAGALGPWLGDWIERVEREGVESWARVTMPGRMGGSLSPEAMEWWTKLMGEAPAATVLSCFRLLPGIPEPPNPEGVRCPTLFVMAAGDGKADSYDQRPALTDLQRLQARVKGSERVEIKADSYHIAATHPDACAIEAAAFIDEANGVMAEARSAS